MFARLARASLAFTSPLDVATLTDLAAMRDLINSIEEAVVAALLANGVSWTEMASELGVSRQSLHYRLRKRVAAQRESARTATLSPREWNGLQREIADQASRIGQLPSDSIARATRPNDTA